MFLSFDLCFMVLWLNLLKKVFTNTLAIIHQKPIFWYRYYTISVGGLYE